MSACFIFLFLFPHTQLLEVNLKVHLYTYLCNLPAHTLHFARESAWYFAIKKFIIENLAQLKLSISNSSHAIETCICNRTI